MGTRLYVGRLPLSKNVQDLNALFASCGTVESARIAMDESSGLSRGFGFVRMSSEAEAENAISRLNATEMEGRELIVRLAKSQTDKLPRAPKDSGTI